MQRGERRLEALRISAGDRQNLQIRVRVVVRFVQGGDQSRQGLLRLGDALKGNRLAAFVVLERGRRVPAPGERHRHGLAIPVGTDRQIGPPESAESVFHVTPRDVLQHVWRGRLRPDGGDVGRHGARGRRGNQRRGSFGRRVFRLGHQTRHHIATSSCTNVGATTMT